MLENAKALLKDSIFLLAAIAAMLTYSNSVRADICSTEIAWGEGALRICSDSSIFANNDSVTRAIIAVHDTGIDAKSTFDIMMQDRNEEGIGSETTIVAPQFFNSRKMITDNNLDTDFHSYWSGHEWIYGQNAVNGSRLSSFLWADGIARVLIRNKPNLQHITFVGFSGGGQYVNHFSAFTGTEEDANNNGIEVNYVVGGPSMYLYLNDARPNPNNSCTRCNDYPWGLENRNSYPYTLSTSDYDAFNNVLWRNTNYVTGTSDTAGWTEDVHMVQGKNRIDRMRKYKDHLISVCSMRARRDCTDDYADKFVEVSGLAHTMDVFDDPDARDFIFHQ